MRRVRPPRRALLLARRRLPRRRTPRMRAWVPRLQRLQAERRVLQPRAVHRQRRARRLELLQPRGWQDS